jgi:WD40 repeat protein
VATSSQDRTIKLWGLPGLTPGLTLRGHKRGVWGLTFSPVDKVGGVGLGGGEQEGGVGVDKVCVVCVWGGGGGVAGTWVWLLCC